MIVKNHYKLFIVWTLALSFISVFIIKVNYVARENDSRLYSIFTKQLSEKPLPQILALEWKNSSSFSELESPFVRDHLIGQFILPVLLAKIGVSSKHSIYITNCIYKALSLWLIYLIARIFFSSKVSSFLTILIQLTPISLNYQMRANHEPALLLLTLCCILSAIKIKESRIYFILMIFSFNFCFLIKGIAFIPIFPISLGSYLIYNYLGNSISKKNIQLCLISFLSVGVLAIIYEYYFRYLTGLRFFDQYFKIQFLSRSFTKAASEIPLLGNIKALFYYTSRLFSYSLPWSLLGLSLLIKDRFNVSNIKKRTFYFIMITSSLIYILTFCISSRLASRYIYPAYYFLSMASIVYIIDKFESKIRIKAFSSHLISCILFFILTILSIYRGINNHLLYQH